MVSVTLNGSQGSLQILDALRDIRGNVQNTIQSFSISGYSGAYPSQIINYPEQTRGYVYSSTDGALAAINYGTEASLGSAGSFGGVSTSVAVAQDDSRLYGAVESAGSLVVIDNSTSRSYVLNLPNVYKVAVNQGNTIALAMVRNSNALYRVVKLNTNTIYNTAAGATNPLFPPGAVDCQPYILPVYCVVPVPTNNTLNRPSDAYFSLDGSTAYVINCGTECGGTTPATLPGSTASITPFASGLLTVNNIPSTASPSVAVDSPSIAIPGGVTTMISDGTNLYLAGQQLQADGRFAGRLTVMPLATQVPGTPVSISDGNHSKILFADDNTLWIGSQYCATGERAYQASQNVTTQAANYNCLTMVKLATSTTSLTAQVIPNAVTGTSAVVPYPNLNNNQFYYGSLTGLCWVQNYHKVYTAYGGQVHAFNTTDGSEINNANIAVQGTVLDVAYMDAITNNAD